MRGSKIKTSGSASKLMLYAMIGVLIGLAVTLSAIRAIEGELPQPFLIFVFIVCVPATLLYLWTHRSPDNKHFNVE